MSIYTPYTYLVGWSNHNKYYYGARYKQGCHPNDFWNEYYTSSVKVGEYREQYGEPDVIQIRKTFDSKESAIAWEHKVLRRMKVISEDHWMNKAAWPAVDNRGIKRSEEHKKKISKAQKGKTLSAETKQKLREANKGKTHSAETKRKMSEAAKGKNNPNYGKTRSAETKRKMSEARKKAWAKRKAKKEVLPIIRLDIS